MRSAGYFHIIRDDIQRCLHEQFIFLNEKESQDYLSLINTINDINDKVGRQKQALYKILLKYREAFSLRDEIGLCPNIEVKLKLKDKPPFYIRPFQLRKKKRLLMSKYRSEIEIKG